MIRQLRPLCYFSIQSQSQFRYFDNDFKPLNQLVLSGYYSFLCYQNPNLLVMSELIEYGSCHGGLESLVQAIKRQTTTYRNYFFTKKDKPFFLPNDVPSYGGGVLYWHNKVVCCHGKSQYSKEYLAYNDNNSQLEQLIYKSGFPQDRYISVKQADYFDRNFLPLLLSPEGQFPARYLSWDIVNLICQIVQLPPLKLNAEPSLLKTPALSP